MKKQFFLFVLLAVFSLIAAGQSASAQSGISVYSTVDYDANNNTVSGYSYTYGTYDNAGYYTTQVTSFIYSDTSMVASGTASGNSLEAYLPLTATGTGCGEYLIASFHHVTAQYYVTYYFYYGNYIDGYYDPFNYLGFSEQGQSLPYPVSFFAPVDSSVRILNQAQIELGYTEEYSSGNCAPPTVQLTPPIEAIPKGGNAYVGVTVNGFNARIPITLDLRRTSGTGDAKFFKDGNLTTTIPITSATSTIEIKGITESSTKDNIQLGVKIGSKGNVTPKDTFSILWVTLNIQNSGFVSTDNAARQNQITDIGTDELKTLFSNTDETIKAWRTCVQITGTVSPHNFTGTIALPRAKTVRAFVDTTLITSLNQDDTSDPQNSRYVDFNPQPNGKVYDLDCPAIYFNEKNGPAPIGLIQRVRTNFKQFAMFNNERVSDDLSWYSRLSIIKTSSGTSLQNDVTNDNKAAGGTTNLTWNLQ